MDTVFRFGNDGKMYVHGEEVVLASERDRYRDTLCKIRDGAFDGQRGEWWYRLATGALNGS